MNRLVIGLIVAGTLMPAAAASAQQPHTTPQAAAANASHPKEGEPPEERETPRVAETVQVTATRGTTDANRAPASASVVSSEEAERRAVVAADQALATVEGVYAYRQRGIADNEAGIGMRGFSGRGNGQSRVLVLLDGQPLNDGYTGAVDWSSLPLGEIERIEVVRGGFSALYGGNAMGGVVHLITRPVGRTLAQISAQHGTFGTTAWSGHVGGRFRGRLGLSFGYDGVHTDGYRAQEVTRTATAALPGDGTPISGPVRFLTRTGTVTYGVGLRGENRYERQGLRARGEYTIGTSTVASLQYVRRSNDYGWGRYDTWLRDAAGNAVDSGAVVFDDAGTLKRLNVTPSNYLGVVGGGSSHLYQAQLLAAPSDGSQLRVQFGISDVPGDRSASPGATATFDGGPGTHTGQTNRSTFANVQWSSRAGDRHDLTAGADLRIARAAIAVSPTDDYLGGTPGPVRDTYTAGRGRTMAAYVQDQVRLSDRVQLTLGARLDRWRTYDGESQPAPGSEVALFPERDASAMTAKAAFVAELRPGTTVRTSLGSAFRSPSVFDLYRDLVLSSGTKLLGNPGLDPERMISWEAGLRHAFGSRTSVDTAFYENHLRDLIFRSVDLDADPDGRTSRMFNAGQARTRGLELSLRVQPAGWLTIQPVYTFTDAIITSNDRSPATEGAQVPFVPRHVAAVSVTTAIDRLTITSTTRAQTAVFATETNTDTTKQVPGAYDGFVETDLAATFGLTRGLSVHVAVENLLDEQYYLFYRNAGRTVTAGVRWSFSQP